jgi:hypothetical protein
MLKGRNGLELPLLTRRATLNTSRARLIEC